MTRLLEVRQISQRFGSTRALRRASFALDVGEVHTFVGQHEAGKSTSMKILAGVHQKEEGLTMLDGTKVTPHPVASSKGAAGTVYRETALNGSSTKYKKEI